MKFCSYNIQYGIGKDNQVDLKRIAEDIGEQDVICLQEVERFLPETGMCDQVAKIADHFPNHHWVFGAGVDVDADIRTENGHVQHRRRQFGNMLLARTPILSSRTYLLPKHGLLGPLSLQRALLEGVIDTPTGALRVYTTHLSHGSPLERRDQVKTLLEIIRNGPAKGGVWSGANAPAHWTETGEAPPMPHRAIVMGDFNLTPKEDVYDLIVGPLDPAHGRLSRLDGLVDSWVASDSGSFEQPTCIELARGDRSEREVRLDYAFITPELVPHITSMAIDEGAQGSDHQPIFIDLDL